MTTPTMLHHELSQGKRGPITIYECEHITSGAYRLDNGPNPISTGENTAVLLCAHCVTHLRGTVLADLFIESLRQKSTRELLGDEWIEKALETRSIWGTEDDG